MRPKFLTVEEFQVVYDRDWQPVQLSGEAIPQFLRGIPTEKFYGVYASGGPYNGIDPTGGAIIPTQQLIGGIDVYRHGMGQDAEVKMNWYGVISLNNGGTLLLVIGPYTIDGHHWMDDIPDHLNDVEIVTIASR